MRSSRRRLDACNGRDGQNEVAKREIGDERADAAKIEGEDSHDEAQPEHAVPVWERAIGGAAFGGRRPASAGNSVSGVVRSV